MLMSGDAVGEALGGGSTAPAITPACLSSGMAMLTNMKPSISTMAIERAPTTIQ